jgi:DNA-binding transcriptional ArsR family regulator
MLVTMAEKKPRELERIMKGVANHRRISILRLLEEKPERSLIEICDSLKMNFKTASEHGKKLVAGGLILKQYQGNHVRHALSPRGKAVLKFLSTIE